MSARLPIEQRGPSIDKGYTRSFQDSFYPCGESGSFQEKRFRSLVHVFKPVRYVSGCQQIPLTLGFNFDFMK